MVKCEFWQSIVTAGHIYLSCSASKLLRLKPIWYAIVLEEVGWTERGQEGGYHWLLKLLPLHFRKKHDFYQFFFSFQLKGFCIPSIFFLCIIFCAHTVQIYLPVLFRPLFIFFNMNCFFFFIIPLTVSEGFCLVLRCSCSESVIFYVAVSFLFVITKQITVEVPACTVPHVWIKTCCQHDTLSHLTTWKQGCEFHVKIRWLKLSTSSVLALLVHFFLLLL